VIDKIDTERLILKPPVADDFGMYQQFFSDAMASQAYGGPLPNHFAFRKLASDIGHWKIRGYGMLTIHDRLSGEKVGSCGLVWPEGWPRSELTWWILPAARRNGYACEVSQAVISYAHSKLGWEMVETHMDDDNDAAKGLVKKLGGRLIAREVFPDEVERDVYSFPRGGV